MKTYHSVDPQTYGAQFQAAKITSVPREIGQNSKFVVMTDHTDPHVVTREWLYSNTPKVGDYFVRCANGVELSVDAVRFAIESAEVAPDTAVEANRQLLLERSQVGMKKYGVGLDRAGLSLRELLQHALEETLDHANYLQAAIQTIDRDAVTGKPKE